MKTLATTSRTARTTLWMAILMGAAIATGCQHGPEPKAVGHAGPCYTGDGQNALTIALPAESKYDLEGVYIRRKGCDHWSQNLGVLLPGKSLHILNLDDGEIEVYWREKPHAFGIRPLLKETPPTEVEWSTATATNDGTRINLKAEIHRRIVVS